MMTSKDIKARVHALAQKFIEDLFAQIAEEAIVKVCGPLTLPRKAAKTAADSMRALDNFSRFVFGAAPQKAMLKPVRKAAPRATLRPCASGGFEMALPGGQLWHGTRARDLRRKARQKGVAWQEQGIEDARDGKAAMRIKARKEKPVPLAEAKRRLGF